MSGVWLGNAKLCRQGVRQQYNCLYCGCGGQDNKNSLVITGYGIQHGFWASSLSGFVSHLVSPCDLWTITGSNQVLFCIYLTRIFCEGGLQQLLLSVCSETLLPTLTAVTVMAGDAATKQLYSRCPPRTHSLALPVILKHHRTWWEMKGQLKHAISHHLKPEEERWDGWSIYDVWQLVQQITDNTLHLQPYDGTDGMAKTWRDRQCVGTVGIRTASHVSMAAWWWNVMLCFYVVSMWQLRWQTGLKALLARTKDDISQKVLIWICLVSLWLSC